MKTTEIFIEQVLIGYLVIFAFSLPYVRELWAMLSHGAAVSQIIGIGATLVGAAYLLGTLMDRYSDQILQPVERLVRTQLAIEAQNFPSSRVRINDDPYPEGFLRLHASQS